MVSSDVVHFSAIEILFFVVVFPSKKPTLDNPFVDGHENDDSPTPVELDSERFRRMM